MNECQVFPVATLHSIHLQKEMELKECKRLLADYKQQLEDLEGKSTSLTNDTDTATKQVYRFQEENRKLSCEMKELMGLVVTEDEVKHMQR